MPVYGFRRLPCPTGQSLRRRLRPILMGHPVRCTEPSHRRAEVEPFNGGHLCGGRRLIQERECRADMIASHLTGDIIAARRSVVPDASRIGGQPDTAWADHTTLRGPFIGASSFLTKDTIYAVRISHVVLCPCYKLRRGCAAPAAGAPVAARSRASFLR